MKIEMSIDVEPFHIQEYVYTISGKTEQGCAKPNEGIHISKLEAEALSKMCDIWRKEMFEEAGKNDPRSCSNRSKTNLFKPDPSQPIGADDVRTFDQQRYSEWKSV